MNAKDKKKLEELKQKIIERNKKNKDKRIQPSNKFLDEMHIYLKGKEDKQ